MTHGRAAEAERVVAGIEERFRDEGHDLAARSVPEGTPAAPAATPRSREVFAHHSSSRTASRTMVGLALMAAQAFFYNAIFFTYALVLTDFYGVPGDHVGWYILPFALGNFLGPLLLGPPVRHASAAGR